jgi:hypothetical protein
VALLGIAANAPGNVLTFAWSDGDSPGAGQSNTFVTETLLPAQNDYPLGLGASFTVAATADTKVLDVYVQGFNANTQITARMSGGASTSVVVPPTKNPPDDPTNNYSAGRFTVAFAGAGETLTVTVMTVSPGVPGGVDFPNAGFFAAALRTVDQAIALGSAVLPGSRAVQVGQPATAFATILATGGDGIGCSIVPTNAPPGAVFSYQQTNAANVPIGAPNTPADIPAGGAQTFVFAVTPGQAFSATELHFSFGCTNTNAAPDIPGVNTLLLTASSGPTPDTVALAAAPGGIVTIPGSTGAGAFAVASVNVGADALITIVADTGSAQLPLLLSLCQTNPLTSVCINPAVPAGSVTVQINHGDTPTFAIFAQAMGAIQFSPAVNRIFARFKTQAGGTVGSTSVAVHTQ